MYRIADHFHLVVLIKQECLESDILWKFVQLVQSAVPIDADRTGEVVAFQDVSQLFVVFRLEDEDERDVAVCCRIGTLYSVSGIRYSTCSVTKRVKTISCGNTISFPCHS